MMGSDNNQSFQDDKEEMESLTLDDPLTSTTNSNYMSFADYRSATSSLSATHQLNHPFSPTDSDPLLSPPPPPYSATESGSYIEPPAYADVVFSPFDETSVNEINGVDRNHSLNRSSSSDSSQSFSISRSLSTASNSSSDFMKITVSNPQKEQEAANSLVPGGNTYVTYLITTRTNLPDFDRTEFSVRRRFRDVVTLSDRLAESYRGFFIPPRPDKNVVESQVMQKQEFVEQRRIALEKYLRRLVAHPVIKKSDELKVFLSVQGRLPLATSTDVASRMLDGAVNLPKQLFGESVAVAPSEVVQPAKGGRDLLRIFKELKQSVANDWGGVKPAVVEEDKEFLENKERMQDLEQQLSNASQQVGFVILCNWIVVLMRNE